MYNPWWSGKKLEEGIARFALGELEKLTDNKNFVKVITGPRRAGKTYLMKQMINKLLESVEPERILYVNFEDPEINDPAKIWEEYLQFSKTDDVYLFFDEIQAANDWVSWIRARVDLEQASIFISGSRMFGNEMWSKLGGRATETKVYPLSLDEIMEWKNVVPNTSTGSAICKGVIEEILEFGSYPEVVLSDAKREILISYVNTIISRDLAYTYGLNTHKVEKVFKYLMKNCGALTSKNSIKNTFDMSYETVDAIISAMKQSMLIFEVPFFTESIAKQERLPRKYYPIDIGLRNIVSFAIKKEIGKLFETFVAIELYKKGYDLYYYRDEGECDFIAEKEGKRIALQVTWELNSKNREREEKGLEEAKRKFKIPGEIVTFDNVCEVLSDL